jgi:iron complex transport system substrate-binding protein
MKFTTKNILAAAAVGMAFAMPATAQETRKITDLRGVEVEVPVDVKRIAVFAGPLPAVIYALQGTTANIVGASPFSVKAAKDGMMATMSPEILNAKTDFVVGRFGVNVEELVSLDPDVIIQWIDEPEAMEKMANAGLSVIGLDLSGKGKSQWYFEEWLKILGPLLGKEERAKQMLDLNNEIIKDMAERTASISEADKPKVMLINKLGAGLIEIRGSEADHHNFWITGGGGISVSKDMPGGRNQVNMEQVLEWNPEVIYIRNWNDLTPQDLYDNKVEGQDWSEINAVKNRRVYKVPLGVYVWSSPSAERVLMLYWAAKRNYPEKFKDIDMSKIVTGFYKDFFEYDLSEDEIKKILHFSLNGVL